MTSTARAPSRTASTRSASRANSTRPTTTNSDQNEWIIAILEGRGAGNIVGLAAFDTTTHKIVLNQFPDSPTFVKTTHLLLSRPPSLILVPNSSLNTNMGKDSNGKKGESTMLVKCLRDAWKHVAIVGVDRKYWSEQAGFEFLTQLVFDDEERTPTIVAAKAKYYALSATSALFKYLESAHQLTFASKSLHVRFATLEGNMLIDRDTALNLELVSNLLNRNSKHHLLGLLNHCYTPMGTRLLRTNILSPLTNVEVIDARLDVIEELVGSEERLQALRKALEPLRNLDVDKLVGQLSSPPRQSINSKSDPAKESETKITRLLQLRTLLQSLPAIRTALYRANSALLDQIAEVLKDDRAEEMLEIIAQTINDDAVGAMQKGALAARNTRIYAIRAERKLLLDVARETYKENLADAYDMADAMKEKFGFEISLAYSTAGCTFTCLQADLDSKELPSLFINVVKKGKKMEFSSLDLKKKNARINLSVQEIFLLSDEFLNEVIGEIQKSMAALFRAAEAIAMLDMLAAFASVSSKNDYVRPEWTDSLAIAAGRHPLHEQFRLSDGTFVPNDTYAPEAATFQLVYGTNMSGKSTLLKQIALLYIMAQIGCYVPAQYASFRVIDALLSRLSNDDSIAASLSTFSKEMTTMSMIISTLAMTENSDRRCLVIIDELGRGTSPVEGVGIAHALAEAIIQSQSVCFFATHFKELAVTLSRYPNAVAVHLETEIDNEQPDFSLTFHHRVVDGTTPAAHYGLELAKMAKLPIDVLEKAKEVSTTLESMAENGRLKSEGTQLTIRRKALLQLKSDLRDLSWTTNPDPSVLFERLRRLQQESADLLLSIPADVEEEAPSEVGIDSGREAEEEREDSKMDLSALSVRDEDEEMEMDSGYQEVVLLELSKLSKDIDETLDFD